MPRGVGFGSIEAYQTKRGERYLVRYRKDGVRYKGARTFPSKAQARYYLDIIQRDIELDKWETPKSKSELELDNILFCDYARKFLAEQDVRRHTKRNNQGVFRNHIEGHFQNKQLKEITEQDCKKWYAGLDKTKEYGTWGCLKVLKLLFNQAKKDKLITYSPADIIPTVKPKKLNISKIKSSLLSETEVLALIEATPPKYRLITVLGAYCGLRIGEALALQRKDIDLEERTVNINKQVQYSAGVAHITEPKTPNSNRLVPIPLEAMPHFITHLEDFTGRFPASYLFARPTDGQPLARTYYNDKVFSKARKAIGRPHFRYHDLRHTCLTYYARGGATLADLKAIAGHSTAEVAILYQETSSDHLQELANKFNYNQRIHFDDYKERSSNE
ncbi:MAG: site-specific integrase [Bifidobacteriaceae bacterium]|jgi:integrase|nr:site-specific integrase [Bifidobacteriaceae bacterium]